ncbi:MAG: hypothetical protein ACK5BQ_07480, partial [Ignavibacteria bacterium]
GGTHEDAATRTYNYRAVNAGNSYDVTNNTGSFTGLSAGTYTLSVIALATGSSPACTTSVTSQTINNPSVVTATTAKTNITCNNANDGTISITGAAGGIHTDAGTRTYNYRAVNVAADYDVTNNTGSFTGLGSGTYTLSVIALATGSSPACTTSVISQTIYNPSVVTAITTKTDISCNTATDGVITVSGTAGGTHADATSRTYQYMISKSGGSVTGPQSSATFNGLDAGTYTVSVIAEAIGSTPAGTTQVSPQTIYLPSPITASIAKTNISCNGSVDGTITVTNPQGGTHADAQLRTYQFAIFKQGSQIPIGPQVSGLFENLAAGAYDVFVIAQQVGTAPSCSTFVGTSTILEPSAVTATTSKTNITCNTATDGTISISGATGGVHIEAESRTYNYRAVKSGGGYDVTNNTGSFSGLGAGTYSLSVIALSTGASPACTTSVTAQTIYLPSAITATTAKTNISCNNATDGTITVTNAAGGTHTDASSRTYQYMIAKSGGSTTGPQVSGSFSGLGAGEYTVSVIAQSVGSTPACTTVVSTQNIYLPTAITADVAKTNITCNGSIDGTITVSNPQGGTHADAPARAYTYIIAKQGGGVLGPQVSGSFT